MRISVPFQYEARYVERGHRTPSGCRLTNEVAVEICEVAAVDAPVALLVASAQDGDDSDDLLAPIAGRGRRVLRHAGALWRELGPLEEVAEGVGRRWTEEEADAWQARRNSNPFYMPGHAVLSWIPGGGSTRDEAERATKKGIREWVQDDGGDAAARCIRRRAEEVIAVGGHAFLRCAEPCWRITDLPGEEGRTVVVDLALSAEDAPAYLAEAHRNHWRPQGTHYQRHFFALHRLDDALIFARELAATAGAATVRLAARARVLDPSAIALADDCISIEDAAAMAEETLGDALPGMPRAAVAAWVALRDAREASGGRASPGVAAAVARLAAALPGDYDPRRQPAGFHDAFGPQWFSFSAGSRGQFDGGRRSTDAVEACRVASRRWERRPSELREWVDMAAMPLLAEAGGVVTEQVLTLSDARAVGLALGVDLESAAQAAADGRSTLLVARDAALTLAAALVDGDGTLAWTAGHKGLGAPAGAAAALDTHARAIGGAPRNLEAKRGPI